MMPLRSLLVPAIASISSDQTGFCLQTTRHWRFKTTEYTEATRGPFNKTWHRTLSRYNMFGEVREDGALAS